MKLSKSPILRPVLQPIKKIECEVPVSMGLRKKPENHQTILYFLKPEATHPKYKEKFEKVATFFNKYENEEIYLKRSTGK